MTETKHERLKQALRWYPKMHMSNPVFDRFEKKSNLTKSHRRSKTQEREVAKRVGGRLTPASGAREVKGDVRVKRVVRIECKTTKNKSFSVTREMIEKLEMAATLSGEMPVLVVEFNDGAGRKQGELVICPSYVLDDLVEVN
ncbi:primase [Pseudomonas phage Pa BHU-15]|nr:primase [Pseudomonas phage Pa BHU-15]